MHKQAHERMARKIPEQFLVMLYAAIIGVGGGYGAIGFRKLIDLFSAIFYRRTPSELTNYLHGDRVLFMPALGGLAVGLIVYFLAKEAKGHGVPEVMYAVTEKKGIIRPRIVIVKALASAISIGSGGSVGREGPIVQIGSAWGSAFGQLLGLREHQLATLVACGAAAGIAGTFNAPIGGALFAFEIILGSFSLSTVSSVVVSSVVSAAISRAYLGDVLSFPTPHYSVHNSGALTMFVLLGIVCGLFAWVYIKTLVFFENGWDRIRGLPEWAKPAVGGAIVGLTGFFAPQILGVGYPSVERALAGHMTIGFAILLLLLKLLMTSTTIASGGSGGVFAPGLYMGAMTGYTFGMLAHLILPSLHIMPGTFAVVGMAAVFAGSAHAPITAIIMLFEMTGDYQLMLPIMIATVVSTALTTNLYRENIYTVKLVKRGIDLIGKRIAERQ